MAAAVSVVVPFVGAYAFAIAVSGGRGRRRLVVAVVGAVPLLAAIGFFVAVATTPGR
ncbi:MAG TPA: hypothetical protein VFT42_09275 [Solirubrobacteraceae bacterium]|nr:hypothetical protein [Solirubrobacteraceae bacterium]